ncbi:ZIP family metal transporter [Aquibacillus koreensis]|uniref:ZIP family metal transporter n=1 Tax=Aquibacillus koreensis TaxID=279446 RepID=A0A9X3WNQ3_9BACI|nr:ZIP family metal transporter [Aquibacillus koreensis]MCT2536900.1 ZIP family metal transporter [Aquibacillus koreensis]MDC3421968.1 ZIP family metal transporter [Aquibacillus koreensis]
MSLYFIFISALCTSLGALPIFLIKNVSHKGKDTLLAFTAGVMVAASTYGLIPSALKLSNVGILIVGILIGTLVLTMLESLIPHVDLDHTPNSSPHASVILFLVAMSLHNIPEGLSVGISNVSNSEELGPVVSFAIGIQNIPDGFLVGLFLITLHVSRLKAFLLASMTGFIELIASLVGVAFGEFFEPIIPYGLAFAAGSMLFVVYKELIPESHGDGNERVSTISFILGFLIMILLTEWYR